MIINCIALDRDSTVNTSEILIVLSNMIVDGLLYVMLSLHNVT